MLFWRYTMPFWGRRSMVFMDWLNSSFSWLKKLNKQKENKGKHNVILLNFVYMWRTPPPHMNKLQTVLWGPVFPLRTACLWKKQIYLSLYYYFNNMINIKIQSLNLFSPLHFRVIDYLIYYIFRDLGIFLTYLLWKITFHSKIWCVHQVFKLAPRWWHLSIHHTVYGMNK